MLGATLILLVMLLQSKVLEFHQALPSFPLSSSASPLDLHFKKIIQATRTTNVSIMLATTKIHHKGAMPTVVGSSGEPLKSKMPVLKIVC